jgi:hypothetical protein
MQTNTQQFGSDYKVASSQNTPLFRETTPTGYTSDNPNPNFEWLFSVQNNLIIKQVLQIPNPIEYSFEQIVVSDELEQFFDNSRNYISVINQDTVIEYLMAQSIPTDMIIDMFLETNKIISSAISGNFKLFIEKYDDPETNDHYISVDIRQSSYPDDFLEQIWDIRDRFYKKYSDISWMLITTDFKPLLV